MKAKDVIEALGALAHEHRLGVFRILVERGPAGLQSLQRAGLIAQRRESRQLIYSADFTAMTALVGYLTENCCAESAAECCAPARQPKAARRAAKAA